MNKDIVEEDIITLVEDREKIIDYDALQEIISAPKNIIEPDAIQLIIKDKKIRRGHHVTKQQELAPPVTGVPWSIVIPASIVGILGVIGVAIYLNRKKPKKT